MIRVLRETGLKGPVAECDIRAKVASDAESLERARELLGHADAALTKASLRAQGAGRAAGERSAGKAHERFCSTAFFSDRL